MSRLDRARTAVANALRVLPATGEPGYPPRRENSAPSLHVSYVPVSAPWSDCVEPRHS